MLRLCRDAPACPMRAGRAAVGGAIERCAGRPASTLVDRKVIVGYPVYVRRVSKFPSPTRRKGPLLGAARQWCRGL
jgi:hypothetical protein